MDRNAAHLELSVAPSKSTGNKVAAVIHRAPVKALGEPMYVVSDILSGISLDLAVQ